MDQKEFEKLLEEYKQSKVSTKTNPHGNHERGFNEKAHSYTESIRGKTDLMLAKLIAEKQASIKFASVYVKNDIYHITFMPYGATLDNLPRADYDVIGALYEVKEKSLKLYEEANSGKVKWYVKILRSPVNEFFSFKLKEFLENDLYKEQMDNFCKRVAMIMRMNPHINCPHYAMWISEFICWMREIDDDDQIVSKATEKVLIHLRMIFFQKDRDAYIADQTIEDMVLKASAFLTWQDCSKKCNEQFLKLNFSTERHINVLEELRRRNLAIMEEKKQRREENMNKKRKMMAVADAVEDEENERVNKKMKLDEPPVEPPTDDSAMKD